MQRKRSYEEAMEAGSLRNLLQQNNVPVDGAYNQSSPVIPSDATTQNSAVKDEYLSKSTDVQLQDGGKFENVRSYNSENDLDEIRDDFAKLNYNKHGKTSGSTSDVSRGISVVDELIEEYHTSVMSLSLANLNRRSRIISDRVDIEHESDGKVLNDVDADDAPSLRDEVEMDNMDVAVSYVPYDDGDRSEDAMTDGRMSGGTNYDSDDLLDYDGVEIDRDIEVTMDITIPNQVTAENDSVLPILYTGRNSSRKHRKTPENGGIRSKRFKRLIFRSGETNIPIRLKKAGMLGRFLKDIFTTLIECRWRWITLLFTVSHFVLWLAFGLMFYVASYSNGDISDDPPKIPCIDNGRTFTGIFAFSVETQVSIGYGEKSPTEECPEVIFIMVMEVVAGYALLGGLVSVVYVKIIRPQKNLDGVGFSRHAVICRRDSQLCLVVRVWDIFGKHAVGTRASAWLVKHASSGPVTANISLTPENPLVIWPTTLQHTITETSPFYDMSAKDLLDQKFEVIFSLTGSSRITGMMTQSRTSYLPRDILWGQRFQGVLRYNHEHCVYEVDHKSLNSVQAVDTPLCSARLLQEVTQEGLSSPFFQSTPSSPSTTLTSPGWSFRRDVRPIIIQRSKS